MLLKSTRARINVHAPKTTQKGNGSNGGEEEDDAGEHSQIDEEDMGMSYQELGIYGRLRKIERCVFAHPCC